MRQIVEVLDNGNTATVFEGSNKAVIGYVMNNEGMIVSQVTNPLRFPVHEYEEAPAPRHHVITANDTRYVCVQLPKPLSVDDFLKQFNDKCSSVMIQSLRSLNKTNPIILN